MISIKTGAGRIAHFTHKHFFALLIGSYLVAAAWPGPGLVIRGVSLGRVAVPGGSGMKISLPMAMLSFLLFNAGVGTRLVELGRLVRRPGTLAAGLGANLFLPIAFIFLVSRVMLLWHNPDEVQNILVGLALVASMPIAGSSTAWAQNSNGDLALSLGLVVFSTLLSPISTPFGFHSVGWMAQGDYAEDLHELATQGTGSFLWLCVILPSLAGMLTRLLLGESRAARVRPGLKFVNEINLLVLSYSNAAIALPQAIAQPDPDFLVAILVITGGLCCLAFGAGGLIARLGRVSEASRTSLMFGLGMNNNGTGLVLASMTLADHPRVLLPIIFYNLVQQVVAGFVQSYICRPDRELEAELVREDVPPLSAPRTKV